MTVVNAPTEAKAAARAAWAMGDYHNFAKATVWGRGAELVRACGVRAGQRVLDVAAGTGNTAIPAAEKGATVTMPPRGPVETLACADFTQIAVGFALATDLAIARLNRR
jgi:hypothetical protein